MFTKGQIKAQKLRNEIGLGEAAAKFNVRKELNERQVHIIEKATWFCLATVDENFSPNVSIKAGNPSFVKVKDAKTLTFPLSSGNGMNLHLGDLLSGLEKADGPQISMMFMSRQTGEKVRLKGVAYIPKLTIKPRSAVHICVDIITVWENCPRFFEQILLGKERSFSDKENTFPLWKRLSILQDFLSKSERNLSKKMGLISVEDWRSAIEEGQGDKEYSKDQNFRGFDQWYMRRRSIIQKIRSLLGGKKFDK
jgi:hypothetical protein